MHGRVYGARDQEGSRAPEDETENPGAAKKGRAKAKIKAATDETLMAMAFGKGIATDSELYAQWQKWIDYRRDEKRKPLSARGASDQLDWLLTQPNPAAIIQKSMRNEWTGLFEENNNGRTNQTRTGHAGGTQAERAAFTHSPEDEKRLRDFEATIAERDRERNERSIAN